ncbi:hypothetical protein HMPREF9946_02224 [Acetobacteraceae bacterium AT-5844]|nr:hypothetical protein HMPREF9946_02224 [Acetobacteraceae bacterium AT-5844]
MMDDLEIRFLGDLQRLEVKPGDRFVLTLERAPTPEVTQRVRQAWQAFVGGGVPLLILDPGMKLGAVSAAEE